MSTIMSKAKHLRPYTNVCPWYNIRQDKFFSVEGHKHTYPSISKGDTILKVMLLHQNDVIKRHITKIRFYGNFSVCSNSFK